MLEPRGRGAHGAVYRAIDVEGVIGPVALKLALHPRDERFVREVELLSRLRHPSVPRLVDHGEWRSPAGAPHPYLAMEWVEGIPLYDWAREHGPGSRQVLRCLAMLARALEAVHSAAGVHRDVKGDNVLVSEVDGRVFLTDFGSGHYVGAATLTGPPFPPGTPPYRSPEAWRSVQRPIRVPFVPYAPGPADDVFALGITAYRLVTGEYPPELEPQDGGSRKALDWRSPRALNGRCSVALDALVSRMLSVHPEERGSARELAELMERASRESRADADVPLFDREEERPVATRAPQRVARLTRGRASSHWSVAAGMVGMLAVGLGWMLGALHGEDPVKARVSMHEEEKDGGTVAVGESALSAPVSPSGKPSAWATIALDAPPKPHPGQARPDASGRCPLKQQVSLYGGCWVKLKLAREECEESGYVYKDGACYGPVFARPRPATSGPAD